MTLHFRTSFPNDAAAVADLYLDSRKTFVAFAPLAHTDNEVRDWIAHTLIPSGRVTVAEDDGQIVGMMATSHDGATGWIDHLYLSPSSVSQGIGTRMLERAKTELGIPIRLYTFQENVGACRFYERQGFVAVEFSDGSDNEEHCPDVLYEWNPVVTSYNRRKF